ncbi:MAG: hypothetical protein ACOYMA_05075 [Bacteroidia bacterium]
MKKAILLSILQTITFLCFAQSSNFEIKIAINSKDFANCNRYLYSLNNVSNKYKITILLSSKMSDDSLDIIDEVVKSKIKKFDVLVADSLYFLFANKSQSFITAFKNKSQFLGCNLKDIESKIDTLNELSFESGDSIKLNFNFDRNIKCLIKDNKLYLLNKRTNSLDITNLFNSTTVSINLNRKIIEEHYRKNFNGSNEKLIAMEQLYFSSSSNIPVGITSFCVDDKNIYLMVHSYFAEFELYKNKPDTFLNHVISLLVYKKGMTYPIIYPLTAKLYSAAYNFDETGFSIINDSLLINFFKNNFDNNRVDNKWICKCQLNENLHLDTSNCLVFPTMHREQKLEHHFAQYVLDGDYLMNTVTNELVNHKTKKVVFLNFPFIKAKVNPLMPLGFEQKYSIQDMRVKNNIVKLLYYEDSLYKYLSYNLLTDSIIENYAIINEFNTMNTSPLFFSDRLYYYISKGRRCIIIKDIKPL